MSPQRVLATRRRASVTIIVCAALIVSAFTLSSWSIYHGHNQTCQSRRAMLNVLHDILIDARKATVAKHAKGTRRPVYVFFNRELARTREIRC